MHPTADDASTVAGWSQSLSEAQAWCSRAEHPFPAAVVLTWWREPDVRPWLLCDPDGTPVAYGELWDDEEEDEQEIARLVVDPSRRRSGIGARLVHRLVDQVRDSRRASCLLRVDPDNHDALMLYRSCGFREVDEATADAWNEGQPARYRWLVHDLGARTGDLGDPRRSGR